MKIYTDGAAWHKDGSAGYGVVYCIDDHRYMAEFGPLPPDTTVQQAELWAVIYALDNALVDYPATIFSDSEYIVKSMNQYAYNWLMDRLRWYGVHRPTPFTIPHLYEVLRNRLGDAPLGLLKSSGEPLENQDLWEKLWDRLSYVGTVAFARVESHSGDFWNDLADTNARYGREACYVKYGLTKVATTRNRRLD